MKSKKAGSAAVSAVSEEQKRVIAEIIMRNGGSPVTHTLFATTEGIKGAPLRDIAKEDGLRKVRSLTEYVERISAGHMGVHIELAFAENPNVPSPSLIHHSHGDPVFIKNSLRGQDFVCTGTSRVAVQ